MKLGKYLVQSTTGIACFSGFLKKKRVHKFSYYAKCPSEMVTARSD